MNRSARKRVRSAGVGAAFAVLVQVLLVVPVNAAPATQYGGTVQTAIEWFQAHNGDSSYENMCEKAVENAWGTSGVWPTAAAHWEGAINAGKAHPGDLNPPAGAFVYWRTSQEGHVAVADGQGGFYSTNVHGVIGRGDRLSYYPNYLGWSNPQVPS